jgi:hypothetical protein
MADKSDIMVQENGQHAEHGPIGDHIAIHTETYDIDVDALGTNLPKRYYWSPGFIGTVVVSTKFSQPQPFFKLIQVGSMSRKYLKLPGMGTAIQLFGTD